MPTKGMAECIGVVGVILVSGNVLANVLAGLLHYKDQDTRSVKSVNCVVSKHSRKHN